MLYNKKVLVPIRAVREGSWWLICLLVFLHMLDSLWINLVFFKADWYRPVEMNSGGLVNATLMANAISLVLLVGIVLVGIGRLGPEDLGLKESKLKVAIRFVLGVWLLIQLANVAVGTFTSYPLFSDLWERFGLEMVLGNLIGQVFGNALLEEIIFRGFLLVQLIKKFRHTKHPWLYGLLLSQTIFALSHIPNRLFMGYGLDAALLMDMGLLIIFGCLFALLYLATDNLYLVIGLHALQNAPTLIFEGPMTYGILFGAMLVFIFFWQKLLGEQPVKPWPPIETDRLILRPWAYSDARDMYEYGKDKLVGPSAGWPPHQSIRESKEIIHMFIEDNDVFCIQWKETGKVIGSIGIHERCPEPEMKDLRQREVGYVLNPNYWGRGIMPEAVAAVIEFAKNELELEVLWCGHFDTNKNSRRVIEKCGFDYKFTKDTVLPRFDNKRMTTLFYWIDFR